MIRKLDKIIIGTYEKPDYTQPHSHLLLSLPISRHLSALDLRPSVIPSIGTSLPSGPYQILFIFYLLLLFFFLKLNRFWAFWSSALYFAPRAPADILGWTLCSPRQTTHIKRTDTRSASLACHLLNWNVKRTLVDQVDMTTGGGDASETMCGAAAEKPYNNSKNGTSLRIMGQTILCKAQVKEG